MSTIAVDNARPSAGGTAYSLTDGVAKVVLRYNQVTNTIDFSENVSSVTDSTTGIFTVNYSTNFTNTLYIPGQFSGILATGVPGVFVQETTATTSSINHATYRLSGTNLYADGPFNAITVNGDLA